MKYPLVSDHCQTAIGVAFSIDMASIYLCMCGRARVFLCMFLCIIYKYLYILTMGSLLYEQLEH